MIWENAKTVIFVMSNLKTKLKFHQICISYSTNISAQNSLARVIRKKTDLGKTLNVVTLKQNLAKN